MTNTQNKSIAPMCEVSRTATGSAQWGLEQIGEDAKAPIFHKNNLNVYICGEDAFRRIADDIQHAEVSIDIVCWGFDPAMELTRDKSPEWPRGDTWGDLLQNATLGKLKSGKRVEVRILAWHDPIGSPLVNNMPGYKTASLYERSQPGMLIPSPPSPRDQREMFNSRWYKDVVAGKVKGLSLRTRGGVHKDVLASMEAHAGGKGLAGKGLGKVEFLGMEFLATHHQKTILIDYEGFNPRGYVMGLNSVTDYWDTKAHAFNEPKRGKKWEGAGDAGPGLKPYQDYACRVEGEALTAVCKNFIDAWNKADANGGGAGSNVHRNCDSKNPPGNLIHNLVAPFQQAQILRTLPSVDGSERSIHRLYDQAASFARHYLYIENQYFQHTPWVSELKRLRGEHLTGCQRARLKIEDVPRLHVMVVTPTPERPGMVPRTHDTVTELGHGTSMPNQERLVEDEIRRYEAIQKARERDPLTIPPPQLSEIAKAYKAAGGGKDAEDARKELEGQFAMRTLVASLWTFDRDWSPSKFPVIDRARQEQARYERAVGDFKKSSETGDTANPMPPTKPPAHKKGLDAAYATRYREIYIHSKLMIIDDSMFTLGSANLNLRSFVVDSEINIASDDAVKATSLREQVWAQHTEGQFAGGNATDQVVMAKTFIRWKDTSEKNLQKMTIGEALSCFLVAFHDDRTSTIRMG